MSTLQESAETNNYSVAIQIIGLFIIMLLI